MRTGLISILLLLTVAGVDLSAQGLAGDSVRPITPPEISQQMTPTLFKLGLALILILVLIYLSVFMLKKLTNSRMSKQGLSGAINIVDRHHLSPKKQLCLVKIDKKYLLVGVSEQAINLVADVSDQNFEKPELSAKPTYQGFSFKKLLSEARLNLPVFTHQVDNPRKS